jgi:hypothetical protein
LAGYEKLNDAERLWAESWKSWQLIEKALAELSSNRIGQLIANGYDNNWLLFGGSRRTHGPPSDTKE